MGQFLTASQLSDVHDGRTLGPVCAGDSFELDGDVANTGRLGERERQEPSEQRRRGLVRRGRLLCAAGARRGTLRDAGPARATAPASCRTWRRAHVPPRCTARRRRSDERRDVVALDNCADARRRRRRPRAGARVGGGAQGRPDRASTARASPLRFRPPGEEQHGLREPDRYGGAPRRHARGERRPRRKAGGR